MKRNLVGLLAEVADHLENARSSLNTLEQYRFDQMHEQADQYFDESLEKRAFESYLTSAFQGLAFAFEAAGFQETRAVFMENWKQFSNLTKMEWLPEVDSLLSEPYSYLSRHLYFIKRLVMSPEEESTTRELKRLEELLGQTAVLVRNRAEGPLTEKIIEEIMEDYLRAAYADYQSQPLINGHIKDFIADGGIRSLGAAIEYKLVSTKEELKAALSGVLEDTQGYKGSDIWKRFYAVIYMTSALETAARLNQELTRVDATEWKFIVVNGGIDSPPKKARLQRAK